MWYLLHLRFADLGVSLPEKILPNFPKNISINIETFPLFLPKPC